MGRPLSSTKGIRKIVFTYELSLPAAWMVGIQAFKRKLVRAGVRIPVLHASIDALPKDADMVFAPVALVQAVQARLATAEVIPCTTFLNHQPAYDTMVKRLRSMQASEHKEHKRQRPIIVTYRGEERIG